jgi:peptide deformylase
VTDAITLVRPDDMILREGHIMLSQRSAEVDTFDDELVDLIARMVRIVNDTKAYGLAAVQIGVPLRVIVTRFDGEIMWMVNPVLTRTLNREAVEREGCLSVSPDNWRTVSRPAKCEIAWRDGMGRTYERGFSGKLARILQHEIDHLEGVLITDKPIVKN